MLKTCSISGTIYITLLSDLILLRPLLPKDRNDYSHSMDKEIGAEWPAFFLVERPS